MPANLGGWTGLILLLVVILLFAAPKLPQLARSLGQSMTIFKKEIKNKDVDGESAADSTATVSTATDSAAAKSTVADSVAAPKADGTDSSQPK